MRIQQKKRIGTLFIYLRLFQKKIRDSKLSVKLYLFLFSTTVLTCLVIGSISYNLAKNSLLENAVAMSIDFMKQADMNLDSRIEAVRSNSFDILQTGKMSELLKMTYEEAQEKQIQYKDVLTTEIVQQTVLYDYTENAFLQTNAGYVYTYHKPGKAKIPDEEIERLMRMADEAVTKTHATKWIIFEGNLYFVRRIVDLNYQEKGIACFEMTEDFLEFIDSKQNFLTNDQIVICNEDGEILQNRISVPYEQLNELINYKDRNFLIYTTDYQLAHNKYTVVVLNDTFCDWSILSFIPWNSILEGVNRIAKLIIIVLVIVFIVVILITTLISRLVTKNIMIIEQGMRSYEDGNFDIRLKPASYDEIGLLATQFNYMGTKIVGLMNQLEKKEEEKKQYEIQTLQAQINPHFLYNTLGSIEFACYRKNEKETGEMINALVKLLRFTIKNANKELYLEEEIEYIKNYIKIEEMRYGNAFTVEYQIQQDVQKAIIPGFIYQPLVENSILHGFDMSEKGNKIIISAKREKGYLVLGVQDNGVGMPEEKRAGLLQGNSQKGSGLNSIGLGIVDKRLKDMLGEKYYMSLVSEEGKGTTIQMFLPEEEEE